MALEQFGPKELTRIIGKVLEHGHLVETAARAESRPTFNFYVGKNTLERKDYIMENLIVPVEE